VESHGVRVVALKPVRAVHLSVVSVAFVTAIIFTIGSLDPEGASASSSDILGLFVQVGVFVYLAFACLLLAYALRRRRQ
jgi:hypothetical protein